jgi:ribosomal protein S18 acetylase RimI-like enzyme
VTSASTLRNARASDVPALLALQAAYYRDDGYPFVESVARGVWERLLADGKLGRAWVVEAGPELVGYVVLTLGYSLEYQGLDAFVDEVYLRPEWRGRGLGRAALERAESASVELGVRALHLEIERGKDEAQGLYRSFGFVDDGRILMTKRIGDSGSRASSAVDGRRR